MNKNTSYFIEWIPHNTQISMCKIAPKNEKVSATILGNSTAIQNSFKNISENFTSLYRRRAFIHWFTAEGLE